MKTIISFFLILLFVSVSLNTVAQSTSSQWTKHKAKKWFKKKEWSNGLQMLPHKTINMQEFARQYQANKIYWDEAFAFLKEHDMQTLPVGRTSIDSDNVYALVTQNPTKDFDSTQWESHRRYIDLQHVISGEEKIGVYPITKLTITKPYDTIKDLVNYSGEGKIYNASPDSFFIFFPSDGHRPNITTGGKKADKKIVIKIRNSD